MNKAKKREELIATLQKVEQEMGRLATVRAEIRGAVSLLEMQIAEEAEPLPPDVQPNRATRRRLKKLNGSGVGAEAPKAD